MLKNKIRNNINSKFNSKTNNKNSSGFILIELIIYSVLTCFFIQFVFIGFNLISKARDVSKRSDNLIELITAVHNLERDIKLSNKIKLVGEKLLISIPEKSYSKKIYLQKNYHKKSNSKRSNSKKYIEKSYKLDNRLINNQYIKRDIKPANRSNNNSRTFAWYLKDGSLLRQEKTIDRKNTSVAARNIKTLRFAVLQNNLKNTQNWQSNLKNIPIGKANGFQKDFNLKDISNSLRENLKDSSRNFKDNNQNRLENNLGVKIYIKNLNNQKINKVILSKYFN